MTLLAAEPHVPYRRPPLTKEFLRGRIGADELPIEADAWFRENDVDLRRGAEVAALHPGSRRSSSRPASCWPTASACSAPAPSRCGPRCRAPTTRASTRSGRSRTRRRLAATMRSGLRVVVVGSGFIGCEAAASLAMRGVAVTVVTPEDAPQSERLGPEVGARLRAWLEEAGSSVATGVEVTGIRDEGGAMAVVLDSGREVPCDRAVLGTGVRPRIGAGRGRRAPAWRRARFPPTSACARSEDGVRCAGDIALAANPTAGRRLRVEHWGEALAQGEVAGRSHRRRGRTLGRRARLLVDDRPAHDQAGGVGRRLGRDAAGRRRGAASRPGTAAAAARSGCSTHERDRDYERGSRLVAEGAPWPPS